MVGQLITLPLRIGVRSTQLMLRAGEEVAWRAASLAGHAAGAVMPGRAGNDRQQAAPRTAPPERSERVTSDSPRDERVDSEPSPPPPSASDALAQREQRQGPPVAPAPVPEEPPPTPHVSEEPELVEELAEPGAEDGAGAQVNVAEPWSGYARMSAKEVISRLSEATPAELAAVHLYESGNRARQTVLAAVERELKTTTGRARQSRKEQANA